MGHHVLIIRDELLKVGLLMVTDRHEEAQAELFRLIGKYNTEAGEFEQAMDEWARIERDPAIISRDEYTTIDEDELPF